MIHWGPYSTLQDLNMDWVLGVIHDAEHLIHNINDIVATYVGRMTITLEQQINAGTAKSMNYARQVEINTDKKIENLKSGTNRKVYDMNQKLINTLESVQASNDNLLNSVRYENQKIRIENERFKRTILAKLNYSVESMEADIKNLKDYINITIGNMEESYNNFQNAINHEISQIRNEFNSRMNDMVSENAEYHRLEYELIENVKTELNAQMLSMAITFDAIIEKKADLKEVLDEFEKIQKQIDDIDVNMSTVINPINGAREPIDSVLEQIYKARCPNPWKLTAEEYDNLQLSAEKYDRYHVTAWEYDNLARWFLIYKPQLIKHFHRDLRRESERIIAEQNVKIDAQNVKIDDQNVKIAKLEHEIKDNTYMFSPISGEYSSISDVIRELIPFIRRGNALTAEGYDILNLTAETYDSKNITAYEYDWNGKLLLEG